jgi:TolB-like protein/class 3 adenylate cyclase
VGILLAREQRRLAAIVAADVVGYSLLMGRDESGTLARLRAHRTDLIDPAIAAHGGRIVKTMGDGLLLEFPSAVDATQCAIEVQMAMAVRNADVPEGERIVLRIGVNLGDIIIDGDDIHGDGVNVAARLEAEAPAGGIVLAGAVHDAVSSRVKATFDDLGDLALKNIERPVRAYRVRVEGAAAVSPSITPPPGTDATLALPDKPSIAVLPFQNMSGDPEQEYFADGMVEDIITGLSRAKELFVIARNSSFTYKGRAVDIKQVGRELGVRYVLEGSVRKAGGRLRITGQLIDAASGNHLWADRFDGALEDVFDLQDRITASVIGELTSRLQLAEMERARAKPTADLTAYDHYLRGVDQVYTWSKDGVAKALAYFQKAISLDRRYAQAYAQAALCYTLRKQSRWMDDMAAERTECVRLARHAIELGHDDSLALATGGFAMAYVGEDLDYAAECLALSLEVNPNLASAWQFSAWVHVYRGYPDEALKHVAMARRLSPRDPLTFQLTTVEGWAHFYAGRYAEAAGLAERLTRQVPKFLPALRMAAVSHAMNGNIAGANIARNQVLALDPAASISVLSNVMPLRLPVDREKWVEALRVAGFPE